MNVLVSLSSYLVSEGIKDLLSRNGHNGATAVRNGSAPAGFAPDVILVDIAGIREDLVVAIARQRFFSWIQEKRRKG